MHAPGNLLAGVHKHNKFNVNSRIGENIQIHWQCCFRELANTSLEVSSEFLIRWTCRFEFKIVAVVKRSKDFKQKENISLAWHELEKAVINY